MRTPKRTTHVRYLLSALVVWVLWSACLATFTWRVYFQESHLVDLRWSRQVRPPLADRLVIVLTDSIPFSMAFEPEYYPFFRSSRSRGVWGMQWTTEPSMTAVLLNTIVTGNHPFMWTTLTNWKMQLLAHETFLDGLKEQGLRMEAWGDIPWGDQTSDRLRRHYTLAEEGKDSCGKPIHWRHKMLDMASRITDAARWAIEQDDFEVLVWHLACTDQVVHLAFRDSEMTKRVWRYTDRLFERMVHDLDDGRTVFVFLSDHGCAANGRHGTSDPEAREAYYLMFGPGVRSAGRHDILQQDIAPTILALFGRTPNAPSAGRPLVEALELDERSKTDALLEAARQRIRYLAVKKQRGRRYVPPLASASARLEEAREAADRGELDNAKATASSVIRRLDRAAVAARRSNQWDEPIAWWLALGLVLAALLAGMILTDGRVSAPDPALLWSQLAVALPLGASLFWDLPLVWPILLILAAAIHLYRLLPRIWKDGKTTRFFAIALPCLAAYLTGVTLLHLWTGIICNTILFEITESAQSVFVYSVQILALVGIAALLVFRKPIRASLEESPFAWSAVGSVLLAASNGYYQGFYFPFLTGVLVVLLWRGIPESFAPSGRLERAACAMLPLAGCLLVFDWQTTWDRHYHYVRYWLDERALLGGLGAGMLYLALVAVARWQSSLEREGRADRPQDTSRWPAEQWAAAIYLALVVAARHILWPTVPEQDTASLGDYLLAARPAHLLFSCATLPALLALVRRKSATPTLITLCLAAITAIVGSPFESVAVLALLTLMVPLASHPAFKKNDSLVIPLAAFSIVAVRLMVHVVFDFKLNYTRVHDLMGFAPSLDTELWVKMLPSIALRNLPATALVTWLFVRRLDSKKVLQAGLMAIFFLSARALYIVVLAHLSRHQLYLNWRNMGEVVFYGFWAASLAISLPLSALAAREGSRRG
jgi:hypothetical protein